MGPQKPQKAPQKDRAKASNMSPGQRVAGGQRRPSDELQVSLGADEFAWVKASLKAWGITTAQEREAFFRGAVFAGIAQARRARQTRWKKLYKAIQPAAMKHLKHGVVLEGVKEIVEGGRKGVGAGDVGGSHGS